MMPSTLSRLGLWLATEENANMIQMFSGMWFYYIQTATEQFVKACVYVKFCDNKLSIWTSLSIQYNMILHTTEILATT